MTVLRMKRDLCDESINISLPVRNAASTKHEQSSKPQEKLFL